MMISMLKDYRYRNGEPARILCVDGNDPNLPVISMTEDGNLRAHRADGTTWGDGHVLDLIEVTPYDNFHEGDIVKLCSDSDRVIYRVWSHVGECGKPYCIDSFGDPYAIYPTVHSITLVCRRENIEPCD